MHQREHVVGRRVVRICIERLARLLDGDLELRIGVEQANARSVLALARACGDAGLGRDLAAVPRTCCWRITCSNT